jgi:2-methylisocitrate lyase-like PEP mutase family enzyme
MKTTASSSPAATFRALHTDGRLQELGVRRLSLGMALAQAALGTVRRHCLALLERGEYGGLFDEQVAYGEMNTLLARD